MSGMARFRGHFYNWYDTSDLRPLDPKYVSSVDSGNLAGHLIALANACREWRTAQPDALVLPRRNRRRRRSDARRGGAPARRPQDPDRHLAPARRRLGRARRCDARTASRPERTWPPSRKARASGRHHGRHRAGACQPNAATTASSDMLFWAQASVNAIAAHRDDFSRSRRDLCLAASAGAARGAGRGRWRWPWISASCIDRQRNLLSIGCLAPEGELDPNCYDLLASEARLASFFAIAKGDIPARHWFRLGRARDPRRAAAPALISWSGSMFEYLMPSLVMRAPAGSLLDADQPSGRRAGRSPSRTSCGCPGASRNRPTTRAISN